MSGLEEKPCALFAETRSPIFDSEKLFRYIIHPFKFIEISSLSLSANDLFCFLPLFTYIYQYYEPK